MDLSVVKGQIIALRVISYEANEGKYMLKLAAIVLLGLLAGCGSSGSGSTSSPGTVSAQSTYSTASVTGTYSLILAGYTPTGDYTKYIGSFTADGSGNITSGALTEYGLNEEQSGTCTVSFLGTYTIQSTAAGTEALTTKPSGSNGCAVTGGIQFSIEAANQGETLLVVESDGTGLLSGIAAKQ